MDRRAVRCPNCGAAPPFAVSFFGKALRVVAILILIMAALGLGATGACIVLLSGMDGPPDLMTTATGIAMCAAAALCVWGIICLSKNL